MDKDIRSDISRAFLVTAWPIVARYNLAAGMLRDTLARCTFKGHPPSPDLSSCGSSLQKAGDLSVLPGQSNPFFSVAADSLQKGRSIRTVIDVGTVLRPFKCN